jgi:hypothetical protein
LSLSISSDSLDRESDFYIVGLDKCVDSPTESKTTFLKPSISSTVKPWHVMAADLGSKTKKEDSDARTPNFQKELSPTLRERSNT